jgi:hypothetical protein
VAVTRHKGISHIQTKKVSNLMVKEKKKDKTKVLDRVSSFIKF